MAQRVTIQPGGKNSVCVVVPAVPRDYCFWFYTIDQARDFCWLCGFTWSIEVPTQGGG